MRGRVEGSMQLARQSQPSFVRHPGFPEIQGVVLVCWPSYSLRVVIFGYVNASIGQGIDK
jgi:hypothetical protein